MKLSNSDKEYVKEKLIKDINNSLEATLNRLLDEYDEKLGGEIVAFFDELKAKINK